MEKKLKMTVIEVVELPFNLGLKQLHPTKEPGVRFLPAALKAHGFYTMLLPKTVHTLEAPEYRMEMDAKSGVLNADAIVGYATKQAGLLQQLLSRKAFAVVVGGDCSILIGSTIALKRLGNFAVFYLDGHTDFVLPHQSGTGGAAGMDLAIVTGHGHEKLTNIDNLKPYIPEQNVWCVGNRCIDYKEYVEEIQKTEINYIDLYELRKMGLEKCCYHFLETVESRQLTGFWLHLDVDILNDLIMPAVDSRQPDGLSYNELTLMLDILLDSDKIAGIQITILDPDLDPDGFYTEKFASVLGPVIAARKSTQNYIE